MDKKIIKASTIITLEGPILKDHCVVVENERIAAMVPIREAPSGKVIDLPETILLPGLVNAHCHLELSKLPEKVSQAESFAGWIVELGKQKLKMTTEDYKNAFEFGVAELLRGGTTTVADHISATTSPEYLLNSPLDGTIYIEVLGVEKNRAEQMYNAAFELKNAGPAARGAHSFSLPGGCHQVTEKPDPLPSPAFSIQITPHSTYSLLPDIFSKVLSHESNIPFSIHIAESFDENLLFQRNGGSLHNFLQRLGETPKTMGETPLEYLRRLKLLPQYCLGIHCNYLEETDVAILKEFAMSVVHCPGSHAYFEHDRFPLGMLMDEEINVCLGTDSLASNYSLSMFEQMRLALDAYPELTPESVLKMATVNSARALRRGHEIGSLAPGKLANLIGIPAKGRNPYEAILNTETTCFSMIRGVLNFS